MEHDHPSVFDFLHSNIKNVEDFFAKMGVRCLRVRCFEFVIKGKLDTTNGLNDKDVFKKWPEPEPAMLDDTAEGDTPKASSTHEDAIFKKSCIPHTLSELYDCKHEVAALLLDDWQNPIDADTIPVDT